MSHEYPVGGRRYDPDERDAAWPARGLPQSRPVRWHIPTFLDQGHVGACVPTSGAEACNAVGTSELAMGPGRQIHRRYQRRWTMADARRWYAAVTLGDEFPGNWTEDPADIDQDTGTSPNALGKVLRDEGVISEWRHADDIGSFLNALQLGPVLLGVWWHASMSEPDHNGIIRPDGRKIGGHEVTAIGDDARYQIEIRNHWRKPDGSKWGVAGNAFIRYDDLADLLADQGEGTTFERLPQPS